MTKRRSAGMTITRVTKLWVRAEDGMIGISQFSVNPRPQAELVMSMTHPAFVTGHHEERIEVYAAPNVEFDRGVLNQVLEYIQHWEE